MENKLLLKNGQIFRNGQFAHCDVLCVDGRIREIGTEIPVDQSARIVSCNGNRVLPGFIDIHTHGGNGVDVNHASAKDLQKLSRFFASQGTTSWLASVLTDTQEKTLWCIDQINTVMREKSEGAQLLGVHLEGPFLSSAYKGAMPENLLKAADLSLFRTYQREAEGAIKYITVSPEVEGAAQFIHEIAEETAVALGHSGADYPTTMACLQNGARSFTHMMNAMRLMHQHEPAIMGAALESDAWCELICDGRHLHPATVRILIKAKGWDRVIAITDSIMAAGLPDGKYQLGINDISVVDGDAKLSADGTRAGSTLTTINALRNIVKFTNSPVETVIPMLTANPAKAIRVFDRKGSIDIGKDADFVLIDDSIHIRQVIIGGELFEAAV